MSSRTHDRVSPLTRSQSHWQQEKAGFQDAVPKVEGRERWRACNGNCSGEHMKQCIPGGSGMIPGQVRTHGFWFYSPYLAAPFFSPPGFLSFKTEANVKLK